MQSETSRPVAEQDEDLVAYYIDWTEDAIGQMADLIAKFGETQDPDLHQPIYEIAHNIKGMGSSFGFPLMTQAGTSLCMYMRGLEGKALDKTVLDTHLKSLQLILSKRITGDGGRVGEELIGRLHQLVEHILGA